MTEPTEVTLKGSQRAANQDRTAFFALGDTALWIIADGCTNSNDAGEYVNTFIHRFGEKWCSSCGSIEPANINAIWKDAHSELRNDFINSKGSVMACFLNNKLQTASVFYLGDCRLGEITGEDITWLTMPHNLVVQSGETDEEKIALSDARHGLYKLLKSRRFTPPHRQLIQKIRSSTLILATDGYWGKYPPKLPLQLTSQDVTNHLEKLLPEDDCTVYIELQE